MQLKLITTLLFTTSSFAQFGLDNGNSIGSEITTGQGQGEAAGTAADFPEVLKQKGYTCIAEYVCPCQKAHYACEKVAANRIPLKWACKNKGCYRTDIGDIFT